MGQATKILDDLERNERRRNSWALIIVIIAISAIVLAGFLFSIGETTQLQGVTKGIYGMAGDHGENSYLLVKLDEGPNIMALLPPKAPFIKGSRVIVTERKTKILGIKRYSFLQYVATEEKQSPQ